MFRAILGCTAADCMWKGARRNPDKQSRKRTRATDNADELKSGSDEDDEEDGWEDSEEGWRRMRMQHFMEWLNSSP